MPKGYLLLESGEVFEGEWLGDARDVVGEVVFNTSMTGYQEILTDPSSAGQIVTFCYPLIGNYGVHSIESERSNVHAAGIIVAGDCSEPSHYQSEGTLEQWLTKAKVPGLSGVDTRSLVRYLRDKGTMKGWITCKAPGSMTAGERETFFQTQEFTNLVPSVSVKEQQTYPNSGSHVALIDFGYKKSLLDALLAYDCKVTVVPYSVTLDQLKELQPDGVLFSNGPGNPKELEAHFSELKNISEAYPCLGISLGHQLLALMFGAETEKMPVGHRGANHPVKNLSTGKVIMTTQNHSYAVLESSIEQTSLEVTYLNVNDRTVEGLKHKTLPIQSVQFQPEVYLGPSDTAHVLETFIQAMQQGKARVGEMTYAVI